MSDAHMTVHDHPDQIVLDLEKEGQQRLLSPPIQRAYDPAPLRHQMRAVLAGALVILLALTVLIPFGIILWAPDRAQAAQDHLSVVFTALVALVGSAVGYYFGTRSATGA